MGLLRQSCGGSSAGTGISSVTISGCLNGSGIPSSPLSIKIDPTGLIGCGAAGLKLLNAPSGGGSASPASPVNAIQFNNAGSFGGSSGLTWDGSGLIIGGLTTTGTLFKAGRAVDATSLLELNQYADFISARYATVRGEGIYVAQDSTSNRVGLMGQFGFRVASDLSYGFSDSTSGVATLDVALNRDAADTLALRRTTNAQKFSVYKTYTTGSNYERGVIDWKGSPGVLRIGTEHAGAGVANPVHLITSGTPRIEIAANGQIQFHQAYTFPTGLGASGQTLVNNGAGFLDWGTPYVISSGCVTGSGTLISPLQVKLDPTGLLLCGPNGIRYIGPTGSVGGLPAAPNQSIQFNDGGIFGGSSNLTWDGTNLKLIGGGIQIDGTTNLYPMLTNSADTTNEMQIRLADNSDLANLRVNFIHIGGVSGIRINAAGSGIAAITNNLGLDFQRFCLGGTTNLYPALKKVGTEIEVRLADDSAYTTLRCATLNLSTDVILERDAADTLALRRSANAQKLSVYNTYTSSVNYERGVMDFKGSPGVLRIGTEQQGLGIANPVDIITSGTPRISISALGNIQFNQAYTFPTGIGSSGQTFIHNGTSTLIWGLPSVRATGCLTGSGTVATPLQIQLNPTGMLHCTPLGLAYNGPTGVGGGGGSTSPASPVNSIQFNNAGSFGGSANLTWDGTGVTITGVVTSGIPSLTVSQKWFGPANTNYSGVVLHFIDPSSAAPDSKLLQLQLNGSGMGHFTKEGRLVLPNIGNGKALIRFGTDVGAGIGQQIANVVSIYNNTSGELFRVDGSANITYTFTNALSVGSTDVLLSRDAANSLGVRNSNASQRVNIYKNYNSDSSYERGVLDWQTTPGTLRIGTEQAGAGNVATPLAIVTSGTPRIDIAASGAITFNQAYTFPTDVGGSGQTIVNNGTGGLSWGSPAIQITGGCLTGSGTGASPLQVKMNPTGLINCTANGLAFAGPTGILFNGVQTFGCISGNGTTNSIGIKLDPTGLLTCSTAGLRLSNAPGAGSISTLHLNIAGAGTHANPTTAVDLVHNNGLSGVTIDFRPLIYFTMGQVGTLTADGSIDNQPRFIVPEGFQVEICRAYLTIGQPGDDTTTVQLQRYVATEDCSEPGTNGTPFSKDVTGGCTWVRWTEVENLTLDSLTHLTFRVLTAGTSAENLIAHFWARVTVCYEPEP